MTRERPPTGALRRRRWLDRKLGFSVDVEVAYKPPHRKSLYGDHRPAPDALDGFLFPARLVQENPTMTTPQSNPDEAIPPMITPDQSVEESRETVTGETISDSKSQLTIISPDRLAARERLAKKWPRPPWALKSGTVVVVTTLTKPSNQERGGKT